MNFKPPTDRDLEFISFAGRIEYGDLLVSITDLIDSPIWDMAYDEFKEDISYSNEYNDLSEFVYKACQKKLSALEACWKYKIIGVRSKKSKEIVTVSECDDWWDAYIKFKSDFDAY